MSLALFTRALGWSAGVHGGDQVGFKEPEISCVLELLDCTWTETVRCESSSLRDQRSTPRDDQ
jgi:hypothetical protein